MFQNIPSLIRSSAVNRTISRSVFLRSLSSQPFNRFQKSGPTKEVFDFKKFSERELNVIEKALTPLLSSNPGYEIMRSGPGELKVFVGDEKGIYTFTADYPLGCISIISPVSGIHKYGYDQEEATWTSLEDRHDMHGIITRDFLRHCIGVPQFPGLTTK